MKPLQVGTEWRPNSQHISLALLQRYVVPIGDFGPIWIPMSQVQAPKIVS
jgi:hypothetical protein